MSIRSNSSRRRLPIQRSLIAFARGTRIGVLIICISSLVKIARLRRVLGADHPDSLRTASILVNILCALSEYAVACQLAQDTLIHCRRVLGGSHSITLTTAQNLAVGLTHLGEHAIADQLQEWIRSQRRT
jgi:hypothetical protein